MDVSPLKAVIKIGACVRSRKAVSWRYLDMHNVNYCQLDCKRLVKGNDTMPFGMFKDICEDFMAVRHPLKDIDIILGGGDAPPHPEFGRIVRFLRERRLPDGTYWDCALIQEVVCRYPLPQCLPLCVHHSRGLTSPA